MRLDFTAAAERALQQAQGIARGERADEVRPIDLVRSLLVDDEGQAAELLKSAGLDVEQARRQFPQSTLAVSIGTELQLSVPVRQALNHAGELARLHGTEASAGTDHLLFAVLEADSALRDKLVTAGLDWTRVSKRVAPAEEPIHLDEPLDFAPAGAAVDLARILDAAANRAREAMRVLEDYARFVLDDVLLTRLLKEMRHDLSAVLQQFPEQQLSARDTIADVGAGIATAREMERASLGSVVAANAKRLQEAFRSLEEFGKLHGPQIGEALEQLRYRAYTIEKALVLGGKARTRLADAKLYVLVTEKLCRASLLGTVSEALAGGAQVIQLREKAMPDTALLENARAIRALTRKAGALFIMNDRPDIARLVEADGVHLGQDDLPVHQARRLLGHDALIGVSTRNIEQVRRAVLEGANYLGAGPAFPSRTKEFQNFAGIDFVREVSAETTLPTYVLGGITLENIQQVISAGGNRVAVSQAICASDNPRKAAEAFRRALG